MKDEKEAPHTSTWCRSAPQRRAGLVQGVEFRMAPWPSSEGAGCFTRSQDGEKIRIDGDGEAFAWDEWVGCPVWTFFAKKRC